MALEISTVGAKVKYAVEVSAGTRPTVNYIEIPNVSSAPDFPMDVETLDASDITDTITRYIPGRQDPGTDKEFTLNHTDAVIDFWNDSSTGIVAKYATAKAAGKAMWFEYCYPGASKSYFFKAEPVALGNGGIEQNAVDTIPAKIIPQGGNCWAAASTTSA